jgi:2-iminoacetate synthase
MEQAGIIPVNETSIVEVLRQGADRDAVRVREVLAKARELKGLDKNDVAVLSAISDPELMAALFAAAKEVKNEIYGNRLVLFAPLYVSNMCSNECLYCAFRARNTALRRRVLTQSEIKKEVEILVSQGHKRVLMVAGESYPGEGFDYVLNSIATIYDTRVGNGEIRRINVNIAPLSINEFSRLKGAKIGTYQLFQETYHSETYARMHPSGPKSNYNWRITAMDRAMTAGIDDVGIGVLFGLADWRFEILALLQHAEYLERHFGAGPHTISVPRLEPASGSSIAAQPPHPVSDIDFRRIIAILRLAVPYTGIIMSTRETASLRRETFALGVSQISAGSRSNPGGYLEGEEEGDIAGEQFQLGDHRPLDEVIRDVASLGYIPSFCTACYRLGRTGGDFMDLAKPGKIKAHCGPNALSTFLEYLIDYGSEETRKAGDQVIHDALASMADRPKKTALRLMGRVREGQRDCFC